MTQHINMQRDGAVMHIELNRLDKRNALTGAMYDTISAHLSAAAGDHAIRVVLIAGSEECFCSGNDIKDFANPNRDSSDNPAHRFLKTISNFPKVIVAAVGGVAVGIGTTLLLHCDLVYANPSARFILPFVDLGLVPEAASSLIVPRLVGYPQAAALLMLGEPFGAEQAHRAGLITDVVPQGEALATARIKAHALAAKPPKALRLTKAMMKHATQGEVAAQIEYELKFFEAQLKSAEAQEAFSAFMEKRKPDFSKFE